MLSGKQIRDRSVDPVKLSTWAPGPLVWQPGGTVGPNTFTTFAALYAATEPGAEVLVDTTFAAAVIPSGSWPNLRALRGYIPHPVATTVVSTTDGAVLPGLVEVGPQLGLIVNAATTCPIVRGDDTMLRCLGGGRIQRGAGSAQPAIRFTPGAGSDDILYYVGNTPAGNQDVEIAPLAGATGSVVLVVQDEMSNAYWRGISSDTVYAAGPQANLAILNLHFFSMSAWYNTDSPLDFPSMAPGVWEVEDQSGTPVAQFAVGSSTTGVGSVTGTLPPGYATTAVAGDHTDRRGLGVTMDVYGSLGEFLVECDGAGTATNPTTFQLTQNGEDVPGASCVVNVGPAGVQSGTASFLLRVMPGDYFNVRYVTTTTLSVPFANVCAHARAATG